MDRLIEPITKLSKKVDDCSLTSLPTVHDHHPADDDERKNDDCSLTSLPTVGDHPTDNDEWKIPGVRSKSSHVGGAASPLEDDIHASVQETNLVGAASRAKNETNPVVTLLRKKRAHEVYERMFQQSMIEREAEARARQAKRRAAAAAAAATPAAASTAANDKTNPVVTPSRTALDVYQEMLGFPVTTRQDPNIIHHYGDFYLESTVEPNPERNELLR